MTCQQEPKVLFPATMWNREEQLMLNRPTSPKDHSTSGEEVLSQRTLSILRCRVFLALSQLLGADNWFQPEGGGLGEALAALGHGASLLGLKVGWCFWV